MSRRMSRQRDDEDFYRDCKACFLTIYDDIDDRIESKKTLNTLLQTSGRNPTRARLDKYWTRDTDELAFDDYLDICKKEPVTSSDDLMKAFQKIDLNGDGYISLDELYKIMNAQGENMTRNEVRKIIDEVDDNKDGRLDYNEIYSKKSPVVQRDRFYYEEFTNMVLKTSEDSKKFAVKVMERKERKKRRIEKARLSGMGQKQLTDDLSGEGKGDNSHTNTFGSNTSLRSGRDLEQPKEPEKENLGSRTSLRSDGQVHSSKVSLRSVAKDPIGSKVSLKEGSKHESLTGSKVSLEEDSRDVHGSKVSLRSVSKRSLGSKTSLREAAKTSAMQGDVGGSSVSVRSGLGDEIHGSKVSLKASAGDVSGSRVSLRSSSGQGSGSRLSLRTGIKAGQGSSVSVRGGDNSGDNSDDTIKDVDSEGEDRKAKDKATSEGHGLDPKAKPPKPADTPPRSPKQPSPRSLKQEEQQNSARSVGEEIEYDDDFDIVSTGRPTPRVNLNSSRKETPATDTQTTAKADNNKPKVKKDEKDDDDVQGSQSSLRSAGDLGTPVPSPRKTLSSRLSEDDVPKPSPRVTLKGSKGKSPSVKSSAKLPDPRSLRDWTKFTSKGCFFYEEDEIVSHVFKLRLRDDSNVFLSANPITDTPSCLSLPSTEPVDTSLYVFDARGRLVTSAEQRDVSGRYGVKLELTAGEYIVLPFTTGCRFKQRQQDQQHNMKEAKLIKKDKEDNVVITSAFRRALEDIFELCDLDDNGTMSYEEFNWFNLRTSGEELEEDEWKVVEERTTLGDNGEITKQGFIALNEMEAEDVKGDTEDLWITLTSMGMNKALIMDEACPYRVEIYVEEVGSKKPTFKVTGIESLEKKEFADEICRNILEKGEPTKVRNMKDLYTCTYKTEHFTTIVIDNRSRSTVNLEVDCSRSRNVVSNRPALDHTFEIDPQTAAVAHHLLPNSELKDWNVNVTETIHK